MKIKVLEETIKLNVGGLLAVYSKGDEVTVTDEIGAICCTHGWAEDVAGDLPTGDRVPGANGEVVPNAVSQTVS